MLNQNPSTGAQPTMFIWASSSATQSSVLLLTRATSAIGVRAKPWIYQPSNGKNAIGWPVPRATITTQLSGSAFAASSGR